MKSATNPSIGVLLIGHGTRDQLGTEEFLALSASLAAKHPSFEWHSCFLELRQPDISTGIRQLLSQGVRRLIVAPVLLFAARHARSDIPQEVIRSLEGISGVMFQQTEALDSHPELLQLADQRLQEAVASVAGDPRPKEAQNLTSGPTHCLIVARGTSDPQAQQSIENFVAARKPAIVDRLGTCGVSLAYVAAAAPKLRDALETILAQQPRRLVVQPHILFHGEVLSEIRHLAETMSARSPATELIIADHLGAGLITQTRGSDLLIAALADRLQRSLEALEADS